MRERHERFEGIGFAAVVVVGAALARESTKTTAKNE